MRTTQSSGYRPGECASGPGVYTPLPTHPCPSVCWDTPQAQVHAVDRMIYR